MPRRLPKLILCDLGNVLINFDHRIAVRRIQPYTQKSFSEVYQLFFDSSSTKDYEEGRISSRVFFKMLKSQLGLKKISFKDFAPIWSEIFSENKGMVELLEKLKGNYRLRLVSNINELHYLYIKRAFPRHVGIFDKVILSYEVGKRKPALEIYRAALRGAGVRLEDVLYTDDRADLIASAKKFGIPSLVFKGVKDFHRQLKKRGILA